MQVVHGYRALSSAGPQRVIALGNFDGVHVGHRALLERTVTRARELGAQAWAFTFDPHPSAILAPGRSPAQITTLARKLELFAAAGLHGCVVEPFDAAFAARSGDEFVDDLLIEHLHARAIVVGWDFTYGRGRQGDVSTLRAHGERRGIEVEVIAQVMVNGEGASSTKVRQHLIAGELAAAQRLLGRCYDVDGIVVHGAKRGRTIGIPTANVAANGVILLPKGIYAVRMSVDGGPMLDAVASLGTNPTFVASGGITLEVHVLEFDQDIYDRAVRVQFVGKLRDEAKYDSIDALIEQIHRDIADGRALLANSPTLSTSAKSP